MSMFKALIFLAYWKNISHSASSDTFLVDLSNLLKNIEKNFIPYFLYFQHTFINNTKFNNFNKKINSAEN